ncbi:MAG TPA: hypothetical protein VHY83_15215 [Solirubrobacteraceae bacterium]|nr:hypothetical protein [Solirubrobacteraceae bacterium]
MLIATDEAFVKTFGLIVTFGGIGVIVNVILIYIAVQVRGERRQNEESLSPGSPGED